MTILYVTPENPLLWAFLMENFYLGIAKMSVTPENPLFPNPVLPKTSVQAPFITAVFARVCLGGHIKRGPLYLFHQPSIIIFRMQDEKIDWNRMVFFATEKPQLVKPTDFLSLFRLRCNALLLRFKAPIRVGHRGEGGGYPPL